MEESELVRRAQGGDRQAFDELWLQYFERLYEKAKWILMADFQECYFLEAKEKCFIKIGTFKGNSSFGTWAYSLVVNHFLDIRRKERRGELVPAAMPSGWRKLNRRYEPQLNWLEWKELASHLNRGLSKISPQDQEILKTRCGVTSISGRFYFQTELGADTDYQRSFASCAAILNITEGAARKRFLLARRRMMRQTATVAAAWDIGNKKSGNEMWDFCRLRI